MTRARDAATNSHVATFVHPTGAGNQHVPAAGAAGQLLQYASAGTAAWATVSTSADNVVFPNIASPNNTYTSSGTWSKGSLSDDDYVWFYLVGGGGGGGSKDRTTASIYAAGGVGGTAILIYGKAKMFDGAAYVIAAGAAGRDVPNYEPTPITHSTLTLTSANGSNLYSTAESVGNNANIFIYLDGARVTQSVTSVVAVSNPSNIFTVPSGTPTGWSGAFTGTYLSYSWTGGVSAFHQTAGGNGIFGGGGGGGYHHSDGVDRPSGGSLYAGAGGNVGNTGSAGSVPGGGGGGSKTYGTDGGDGANGNLRVYHV